MRFEALEARTLFAIDLGAIGGLASYNLSGTENPIAGVVMGLHGDNGDGVFNPATDILLSSTTTASNGRYRFDSLLAGNYFVQQGAFVVGSATLPAVASNLITITPAEAAGTMYTIIDAFDTTHQVATATSGTPFAISTAAASEAIGGFRKLLVTLDQPSGTVTLAANDPNSGLARLEFSATATATGSRRVTWDGSGNAADSTNFTGLGGFDLTDGGKNTGISLRVNADKPGSVTMRLYTDAGNSSTAAISFPDTAGNLTQVFLPFSSFVAMTGGGATLTNLGAIQIDVDAASAAADGYIDVLGGFGPTVETVNFINQPIDLAITKTVDSASPQVNGQVTFTVTVTNHGAGGASGVRVLDFLPAGLSFVSAQATQGFYNTVSGLWHVGAVAQSTSQTLTLVATVTSPGVKTNTAQVWTANEFDIDSAPGNGHPAEDDLAQVSVTPNVIDLAVTKDVDNATPNVGQDVTFTVVVRNDGPDDATGVRVLDFLPAGLSFVSAQATQGFYNTVSGLWHVGAVAQSTSQMLTLVATVTSPGVKTNTAQVWASNEFDIDSAPGNGDPAEDDLASVSFKPNVIDLAVTKTVDAATPNVGQNVTFTVVVRNDGLDDATGVRVLDFLPAGLSFVSAQATQGFYNTVSGLWHVGAVAQSTSQTLTLVAMVTSPGVKTNTAQVWVAKEFDIDSTPGNGHPAEDDLARVSVTPNVIDLAVTKVVDTPTPLVDELVTFTITIGNSGPNTATGVSVRDLLPAGLVFQSSTASRGKYNSVTGLWNVGSLATGQSETLVISALVTTSAAKVNTAEVFSANEYDIDSTPGSNIPSEDDQASAQVVPRVLGPVKQGGPIPGRFNKLRFLAR